MFASQMRKGACIIMQINILPPLSVKSRMEKMPAELYNVLSDAADLLTGANSSPVRPVTEMQRTAL